MASIPTKLLAVFDNILELMSEEEIYELAQSALYERIVRFID